MPDLAPIEEIHTRLEQRNDLDKEKVKEFKKFVNEYYHEISYGPNSVKLNSLYTKSFQNIPKKSVFFGGDDKIIFGENSQGKTSFLKALQFNLLGLPENKQTHRMTNLIRETDETLQTRGEWLIDDKHMLLNREMAREGRGGK